MLILKIWGNDTPEYIVVKSDIPDKNLHILKEIYPNSVIIKED